MRQNGYYWVVYNSKWTIAEYYGKYWGLAFDENVFYDHDFDEIDERPITREQFERFAHFSEQAINEMLDNISGIREETPNEQASRIGFPPIGHM